MRFFVIVTLILALVGTASATDRTAVPNNPNAYYPLGETQHGPQNGDGLVITVLRDATVYYDLDEFLAVLAGDFFFDDFSWLDWGTISAPSYQFGPVNGYSYTAWAAEEVFSIPGAMSTNAMEDPLTLTFDGLPVTAVGGDFFGTDFDGNPVPTVVTVALDDGTTVELTYPTVFVGFTSEVPITTLTISCGDGLWATYDNFYVGQMATVPVEDRSWGRIKTLYR
jgi:hypothetical protein